MSYSTASIANSARRVRERRRMELELQQQQKQQQQVPLLAPRSPNSSQNDDNECVSSSNNNNNNSNSNHRQSTRSPKSLPLSDLEPIRTITTTTTAAPSKERSRSSSPHEMWLKSSKLQGSTQFGSPPVSPHAATNEVQQPPNTTAATNSSNINAQHRPIFLHRRPPMVSPSSPQQQQQLRSRSWDEGESNSNNNNTNNTYRPPSPSMRSASTSPLPLPSWTLQPKLQQQQQPPTNANANAIISSPLLLSSTQQPTKRLQPRSSSSGSTAGPRIVAELGTFPTISAKPTTTSNNRNSRYSFRRVRSTPTVIGANSSVDGTEVLKLDESLSRSEPVHSTSSSGDDESSIHGKDHGSKINVISNSNSNSPAVSTASSFDENPPTSSHEDNASTVQSLCRMMISNGPRPIHLTLEEKALWDTMQTIRYQALQEGIQQAKNEMLIPTTTSDHNRENKLPLHSRDGSSPHSVDTSWDLGFVELQEQAVIQQRDNHRSLQAIQRVLSDVQTERDEAVGAATLRLHSYNINKSDHLGSQNNLISNKVQTEKEDAIQRDLSAMSEHIVSLERELLNIQHGVKKVEEPDIKVTVEAFGTNSSDEYDAIIEQLEQEKDALQEKLEWKDLVIEQLEKQVATVKVKRDRFDSIDSAASVMSTPQQSTKSSLLENDEVKKELLEKSSALENAKMIIASLENASGSLAADLRKKLRQRDEDVVNLQRELADKQKTLDTLATELRDLQNTHALSIPLQNTEAAQVRRLQLSSRLETNLAEIRAAAVILESTQDASAVSTLSQLLSDSANALRDGIDVIENGVPEERRGPLRYLRELEEKNATIQRLEDTLREQSGEAIRYKSTTDDLLRQRDDEINALHAEIKILRQQCNTNMELITRNELELTALRDSLRVDDDGVGYISDDDPDDDDDAQQVDSSTGSNNDGNIHTSIDYGLSQAEALATLLSRTGSNRSFDSALNRETNAAIQAVVAQSASSNEEIEALKVELIKSRAEHEKVQRQLLVEKESLSTAKMIISSLERASKATMEELRARLQDSNTAIASLLEKSMESEKTSARLRSELDALKISASQQQHQQYQSMYEPVSDETHLLLAPPIQPLLLTETID